MAAEVNYTRTTRGMLNPAADETVNGSDPWSSDVFVSHSSSQTLVAREIKEELTNRGFKVFIYEDDVPAGAPILPAISNAIYRSRRCLMVISHDFIESNYFVSEYRLAMDHQNSQRVISCLPVLYRLQVNDLPAEFRHINCLRYDDKDFYTKLERAIRNDVGIETQIAVTQTGVGLAWSYFYGYLDIILPGLEQRVKESTHFQFPVYPKLVIVLPVSCRCPEVMPEDEKFRHVGYIDYKISRAANRERCYKSTVYDFSFTSSRNETQVHCHLMMEFATPLLSLYQMHEGNIAQLKKDQMTNERNTFKEVVNQILNYESIKSKCRGKYLLVDYRDEDEQTTSHKWTKESLSQVVAREVENDMIASGCVDSYLFPAEANSATAESNSATAESISSTAESNSATAESNSATDESNSATDESNSATAESNSATSESNSAMDEYNSAATAESNSATPDSNSATDEWNSATAESNAATAESISATVETISLTAESRSAPVE